MSIQPTGADLLDAARALLRDELIAALPPERRHAALMIANAMAIAERELRRGDGALRDALARLGSPPGEGDLRARLVAANRALCAQLRAGAAADSSRRPALHAHLLATVRDELAVSNPKALADRG